VRNSADVAKIQAHTREQVTRRATGFGIDREKEEAILRKPEWQLTRDERAFLNQRTRSSMGVSGDALRASVDFETSAGKDELRTDPGGVVRSSEDAIRAGAITNAKVYEDGVKNITGAMGGLEALGSTMIEVAKNIKPDEFAKSVKDAAKDFSIPANALGEKVVNLTTAVDRLINTLGGRGSAVDQIKKQVDPTLSR
jgi:hypothetical protein